MTRYFKIVLLAGFFLTGGIFTSCKGNLDIENKEGELSYDEQTTITFSIDGRRSQGKTKATFGDEGCGYDDLGSVNGDVDESTLYSWDVFIYKNGELIFSQEDCQPSANVTCTLSRADIQNVDIYFLGNVLSEINPYNREDEFLNQRILFSDHFEGYRTDIREVCVMPMYKFFLDYNLASSPSMNVSFDRICCKVMLDQISSVPYGETPCVDMFQFKSYYLINTVNAISIEELARQQMADGIYQDTNAFWFSHANPLWTYRTAFSYGNTYINFGSVTDAVYKGTGVETDPYNLFGYTNLLLSWEDEGSIRPSRNTLALYCFPNFIPAPNNETPNATRLVLEAATQGHNADNRFTQKGSFYSIPIIAPNDLTMLPNKEYHITCTISHTGGDCPDLPEPISMQSNITIADWDNTISLNETF